MCEACAYNAPCERVLALRVGCPHACAVASLLESADWPQRRRRRNPPCPPLTAIQLVEPHAAILGVAPAQSRTDFWGSGAWFGSYIDLRNS